MLNNFIGGGQVFLHKMRMLKQVISTTIFVSLVAGILFTFSFGSSKRNNVDWDGAITYVKAQTSLYLHPVLSKIAIGEPKAKIDTYSGGRLWKKNMPASSVLSSHRFKDAIDKASAAVKLLLLQACAFGFAAGCLVFLFWSRFGRDLQDEKKQEGSASVLSSKEVRNKLKKLGKCSDLIIGDMPLVKDMETRHFLITGSTGSGKTNLIHTMLPQIERKGQPVIVLDQTGEMIAKYYNKERGDIIFNPFDARSSTWDFWADCSKWRHLEKFSDTIIGFNSRKNNRSADFWEESAQSIFVALAEVMQESKNFSVEALYKLIARSENEYLYKLLKSKGKDAAKHFSKDNARTIASIMSVLLTNIKPMRFLRDRSSTSSEKSFAIQGYIDSVTRGASNWLFLASDPSSRELVIPLNAALLEIIASRLMSRERDDAQKIWLVIDELASLGTLPTLPKLMQEGRKYGGCIIASTQSTSQLYHNYGEADASNLIGLFRTKFAFSSDDPKMGELYSKLSGTSTIIQQQKNTSFGANAFRDGVSYNEKRENIPLIPYDAFTKLNTGECFVFLPEQTVKLSKIQVPKTKIKDKNSYFIEGQNERGNVVEVMQETLVKPESNS